MVLFDPIIIVKVYFWEKLKGTNIQVLYFVEYIRSFYA